MAEDAENLNVDTGSEGGRPVEVEVELAKSDSEAGVEDDGQLTVDVYQTPDEIIIESPMAGVRPEDLDVSVTSDSVTVRGKREREERIKDENYFYQECYWGKFSRSLILPQEVDAEKTEASIKNGVLTVRLPKLNRQKSKRLKVKLE